MTKEKIVTIKFESGDEYFEVEMDFRNSIETATVNVRNGFGRNSAHAAVLDLPFHQLMQAMMTLKEELSI